MAIEMNETRPPIPMIVLGGYLGAGKTTLVNALLRNADGLRVTVLVNDFGSINVDAALIRERGDDVIGLENGCVCCTIGGRLVETLLALGERAERPDLLVIEASGVSDPVRIAQVGLLDREFRLHGIVVAVDADGIDDVLDDRYVGDIARKQIEAASTLVLTKTDLVSEEKLRAVRERLASMGATQVVVTARNGVVPAAVLMPDDERVMPAATGSFASRAIRSTAQALPAGLRSFNVETSQVFDRTRLKAALAMYPGQLWRAKGFVSLQFGAMTELNVVGRRSMLTRRLDLPSQTSVIVIIGIFTDQEQQHLTQALHDACG